MMTSSDVRSEARELLLKAHLTLVHSTSEDDIISALAICTDQAASLRLLYLNSSSDGLPTHVISQTGWHDNDIWRDDPLHGQAFPVKECPLIGDLRNILDPVWFVADIREHLALQGCPYLHTVRAFAAIKLFGAPHVEQAPQWYGVVLIVWSEPHPFSPDERYIFATIAQTVSVVVSNHRLRVEALENLQRLRELDRLKTNFLHMFSHELRTPLTGVLTIADMMLGGAYGELTTDVLQGITTICHSGEHLLRIIRDILDMASIESGTMTLYAEAFDVAEVIARAIGVVRSDAVAKGLSIVSCLPDHLPAVHADRTRLEQVLFNLLSNAVKFSERGTIRVVVEQSAAQLTIGVWDEGIGINQEHHETIFAPFQRLDNALTRQIDGTGLGLSITKRLVELQHGRIWLQSELGKGCRFFFSLPLTGEGYENPPH